jgi:hypothetical protein
LVAAFLIWLAAPASSQAACGGPQTAQPAHRFDGQIPPLAIGDSTMLLSSAGLASSGYAVNAQGCRQFFQAVALLQQLRARHQLPHMVVVALGANGSVSSADIASALNAICCGRLLVLVAPLETGGASNGNAALERAVAKEDPGAVMLLDWVAYSAGHPGWFQPDHLHLTLAGATAFTALLDRALPYAYVIPGC